jgi:membrane protein DedA with SNARE-associated domain
MTATFIVGVVVGAALSLRFNVFILIPGICLGAIIAAVSSVARGDDVWHVVLATVAAVVAIQAGYFAGSVIRGVRRSTKRSGQSLPTGLSHPV